MNPHSLYHQTHCYLPCSSLFLPPFLRSTSLVMLINNVIYHLNLHTVQYDVLQKWIEKLFYLFYNIYFFFKNNKSKVEFREEGLIINARKEVPLFSWRRIIILYTIHFDIWITHRTLTFWNFTVDFRVKLKLCSCFLFTSN